MPLGQAVVGQPVMSASFGEVVEETGLKPSRTPVGVNVPLKKKIFS